MRDRTVDGEWALVWTVGEIDGMDGRMCVC